MKEGVFWCFPSEQPQYWPNWIDLKVNMEEQDTRAQGHTLLTLPSFLLAAPAPAAGSLGQWNPGHPALWRQPAGGWTAGQHQSLSPVSCCWLWRQSKILTMWLWFNVEKLGPYEPTYTCYNEFALVTYPSINCFQECNPSRNRGSPVLELTKLCTYPNKEY